MRKPTKPEIVAIILAILAAAAACVTAFADGEVSPAEAKEVGAKVGVVVEEVINATSGPAPLTAPAAE